MSLGVQRSKKQKFLQEILKSSPPPQYQKVHQNMLIIPPMLDTDLQPWVYKYHNRQCIRNITDSIKAKQVAVYTLYNIHDTTGSVYSILYAV